MIYQLVLIALYAIGYLIFVFFMMGEARAEKETTRITDYLICLLYPVILGSLLFRIVRDTYYEWKFARKARR